MKLLRRVVEINWPKEIDKGGRDLLLRTARNGHKKIMADAATRGLQPSWEAYANNVGNSNLESVKLPGPIVYNYRYLSDLIAFALAELRRQSPVASGAYKEAHALYVNDAPVGDILPRNLTATDKIYIANPLPYARRLEVGRTKKGTPFLVSVPNRIYQRVTEMVKDQSKGRAKINMRYVDLGAHALKKDQPYRIFTRKGVRHSKLQRPDRVAGAVVPSPAIFFQAPI